MAENSLTVLYFRRHPAVPFANGRNHAIFIGTPYLKPSMSRMSSNRSFVHEVLHWYLCVMIVMLAQALLMLLWSFLGPSNMLARFLDSVYTPTASRIGSLLPEETTFSGNIPLGMSLLLWTIMLYSLAAGSVVYLGCRLFIKRVPPNKQ